ncbi:MAG: hypothetical protein ABI488_13035 [Polyangiaceae bacterium]
MFGAHHSPAQNKTLLARAYDPTPHCGRKRQVVVACETSEPVLPSKALFVYDGGDSTLIAPTQSLGGTDALFAHDVSAATSAWENLHVIDAPPSAAACKWAAASDADRHALVAWVRSGLIGEPSEVSFPRLATCNRSVYLLTVCGARHRLTNTHRTQHLGRGWNPPGLGAAR